MTMFSLIFIEHFLQWLRITPGGRNCWNITLRDDTMSNLQNRNIYEYLYLQIIFYATSKSITYSYATVTIVDDERGKKCWAVKLNAFSFAKILWYWTHLVHCIFLQWRESLSLHLLVSWSWLCMFECFMTNRTPSDTKNHCNSTAKQPNFLISSSS